MLVILEIKFNRAAIDAACRVNLINRQLCPVLYGQTIYSCSAGGGSDTANLNHAACRCFCLTAFTSRILRCRGSLCCLGCLCCVGTAACR